eukprot:c35711_g1_i1 orf=1-243(-)
MLIWRCGGVEKMIKYWDAMANKHSLTCIDATNSIDRRLAHRMFPFRYMVIHLILRGAQDPIWKDTIATYVAIQSWKDSRNH